jgi:hypothetical protein
MRRFSPLASLALAAVLSGCPGSIDEEMFRSSREGSTRTDATANEGGAGACPSGVNDVHRDLIVPKCATAGCHSTMARAGALDLESANLGSRLIGVAATSAACAPRALVTVNGATVDGVFFGRLLEAPPCGLRMPLGMPGLTAQEIECMKGYMRTLPSGPAGDAGAMDASARD